MYEGGKQNVKIILEETNFFGKMVNSYKTTDGGNIRLESATSAGEIGMIETQEYIERMKRLQNKVQENDLDAFLVTAQDSIYYLTGVTYVPLERPFFILIKPEDNSVLLAPALDREHLSSAPNVGEFRQYWDYPSPPGEGWPEKLLELLDGLKHLGVEPTMPQEISDQLADFKPRTLGLVEELRLVKSPAEMAKLRRAARYADMGMEKIIAAAYGGVSEIEIFSQARVLR